MPKCVIFALVCFDSKMGPRVCFGSKMGPRVCFVSEMGPRVCFGPKMGPRVCFGSKMGPLWHHGSQASLCPYSLRLREQSCRSVVPEVPEVGLVCESSCWTIDTYQRSAANSVCVPAISQCRPVCGCLSDGKASGRGLRNVSPSSFATTH